MWADEEKMKVVICIGLIWLAGGLVQAQQTATLTGSVSERPLGQADSTDVVVAGARITLTSLKDPAIRVETTTDASGKFTFTNVSPGKYLLLAKREPTSTEPRFRIEAKRTVTLSAQTRQLVDLHLAFYADDACGTSDCGRTIREYVSVAAGDSQTIEQVSKTVNVIDGQQMRDRADFALVESLRTIPGFRVAQFGGFGRLATIKTRGLRNQDTAVLLDGVRFRDPTAITGDASPFLSDLTLTSVSRVEVLRGSGSSLYGTNAIGGVIDVQTPEPPTGTHGQIGVNGGGLGFGRFRGNISHGTSDGKFGIGTGVSRTVYTKGIDGDDRAENTNFQTRVDVNPASRTNISGRIFFSDANVRLNTDPDTKGLLPPVTTIIDAKQGVNFTFDANDPDRSQKTRAFSGHLKAAHAFNERFTVSGYYHGLSTKRTNDNGPLGMGFQSASTSVFDGRIDTVNAQFSWTVVPYNTLTGGYEFEREKFGNDGKTPSGTANFFVRAGQRSNTFFVQDLLSLDENRLQLAGGFRVQQFNLQRPEFSLANAPYTNVTLNDPPAAVTFDGSASYFFPKSGTKLRAHVGNGYRVPSLYERFGTFFSTFPSNSFVPIGAPDLKPERSTAFDAGVEQNLAKERVKLSATYFYTTLFQTIGYGPLPQPDPFGRDNNLSGGGYLNNKGGIARGAEFSGKVRPTDSTDIFTSYTFTNSDQRAVQIPNSRISQSLGIPDHQFTLVATQRYKRFWVNFDFLATSNYLAPIFSNTSFVTRIYRFNGNRRGDLTAGYTFAGKKNSTFRVYGTVENIFDNEYYENGFRTAGAVARAGISFGF